MIFQVRNITFVMWWIETLSTSTSFAISLVSFKAAADIGSFSVRTKSVGITVIRFWTCTFINICSQKKKEKKESILRGLSMMPWSSLRANSPGRSSGGREKEERHRRACSQVSRGPKTSPSYLEECCHKPTPKMAINRLTWLSNIINPHDEELGVNRIHRVGGRLHKFFK